MPPYKYTYFQVRGRGEAIRLLLHDNNIAYEEIDCAPNLDREVWRTQFKPKMPFGQTPVFEDAGFQMCQSMAILRYLGRKHGLYGSCDKDAANIDVINDCVEDLRNAYLKVIFGDYDTEKPKFIVDLKTKLGYFETWMKKNGGDYIAGEKISLADYNLFELLDRLQIFSAPCLDDFPVLKTFYARVLARPGIHKYRTQDPGFKTRKIHFIDRQ